MRTFYFEVDRGTRKVIAITDYEPCVEGCPNPIIPYEIKDSIDPYRYLGLDESYIGKSHIPDTEEEEETEASIRRRLRNIWIDLQVAKELELPNIQELQNKFQEQGNLLKSLL